MPLQFSVKIDRAMYKLITEIIWERKEEDYFPFFFWIPAPGTALDHFTMDAAATAADGIIARFGAFPERLRVTDRKWSRESDASVEEEKLEISGESQHSIPPDS